MAILLLACGSSNEEPTSLGIGGGPQGGGGSPAVGGSDAVGGGHDTQHGCARSLDACTPVGEPVRFEQKISWTSHAWSGSELWLVVESQPNAVHTLATVSASSELSWERPVAVNDAWRGLAYSPELDMGLLAAGASLEWVDGTGQSLGSVSLGQGDHVGVMPVPGGFVATRLRLNDEPLGIDYAVLGATPQTPAWKPLASGPYANTTMWWAHSASKNGVVRYFGLQDDFGAEAAKLYSVGDEGVPLLDQTLAPSDTGAGYLGLLVLRGEELFGVWYDYSDAPNHLWNISSGERWPLPVDQVLSLTLLGDELLITSTATSADTTQATVAVFDTESGTLGPSRELAPGSWLTIATERGLAVVTDDTGEEAFDNTVLLLDCCVSQGDPR